MLDMSPDEARRTRKDRLSREVHHNGWGEPRLAPYWDRPDGGAVLTTPTAPPSPPGEILPPLSRRRRRRGYAQKYNKQGALCKRSSTGLEEPFCKRS